ncbi:MAG TPA: CheR family methyltransferase [Frateuria sp.]|nr:CheR family methyltransferase [Frateuria sp.]HET6805543.1 CheR family methyltransferase [Frateuria sp.]
MILAVGASGAETEALARLLAMLPNGPDLSIVVVLRDREALDEHRLQELLAPHSRTLVTAAEGAPIQGGRLYLPPPGMLATLEEGRFRLRPTEQQPGERGTIDTFFVSMAQDQDGNTIGLVLGETDGDGTLGMSTIKEAGGLTLAIAPTNGAAQEHGEAVGTRALADYALPMEQIPDRIALYMRHFARLREAAASDARSAGELERLAHVATILRNHTGHDFHGYKRATFLRRVQRRMQVVQADTLDAYIQTLQAHAEESRNLFNDLLIGVTQFFRDPREFEFVQTHVVPRLFEGKGRSDSLRIWVLGCSTGEEAYSLAILLREYAATLTAAPTIQIFASDIDSRALAVARVGRYPQSIVDDVSPERLARWFTREGDTYCVAKELREMCVFSQHSVVKDPPFSRLDMVSCRNLLIYLDAELQSRVVPVFHFALKPGGYLFLGNSENVSRYARLFVPLERNFRVFQKIETSERVRAEFPFAPSTRSNGSPELPRPRTPNQGLVRLGERVAERHAPAYAIIDRHFDVVHFSAQAGRFIHPGGGTPSLNLLNLVHRDLRLDLRGALNRAASENRVVRVDGLQMEVCGDPVTVDLVIEPAGDGMQAPAGYVVLFKDGTAMPGGEALVAGSTASRDEHVRSLDAELRTTRERLQSMIEELESTNEELKSSNEEYQSLNEELQSANEELETSKEELQSVNEEVTTVNGELAHRVQELAHANSDLKNLLESTQIATVFLDNELRVTNFTPAVADIFPLVESDLHRPIADMKSRVHYEELQDDARRVLRTLAVIDREVGNPQTGARYMVRILPYRSIDNFIGGVVVTFTDVTPRVRAERALRESEQRLRTLMEGIPQLVWRAQSGGHWTWSSPQWTTYTGQGEAESRGLGWLKAIHPDDREACMQAWAASSSSGTMDMEQRIHSAADNTYRWFHTRSTALRDERGEIVEWLGTSTEIDSLRRMQDEQGVLVAELQHRTRNLITVVQAIASQTLQRSTSLEEFRDAFNDRLGALSRAQSLLCRSDKAPVTLEALLRMELSAVGADLGGEKVSFGGPDVVLRKSAVQTLSLALHELATNARKYGALTTPAGHLRVTWEVVPDGDEGSHVVLDWREDGLQPSTTGSTGGGYGRMLIERALPYNLDARTTYELVDTALRCTIALPLGAKLAPHGET